MNSVAKKAGIIFLFLITGCVTQRTIEEDIERTGQKAYNDWSRQQELQEESTDSLQVQDAETKTVEPLLDGELTVSDAVKLALQYNRQLQVELEERLNANGQMLEAVGGLTPSVGVDGEYLREEDMSGFVVDGEEVTIGSLNNYSATITVEQPLYTGGNAASALRAAKYNRTLTEKNIQSAIEETIYQAISDYYQLLLLQEELEVAQNLVELNEQMLQDVLNNKEVGIATDFNVLVARVDLSNAQTERQVAQNNVDQARAQLLRTLGVSQTSTIELIDELNYNPSLTNREEAVKQALTERPEVASSQMNLKLQEESLRSTYSQYLPTINAYFANTWGQPHPGYSSANELGSFWNAGISLRWNIFNLAREGQIRQERAALRQQQISFYDTQEAALFEVQRALLALDNARQTIETQQLTLEQANEGLRQAQMGLQEGTLTQVEVQEAQQSFSDAQLTYLNSLYNYEIARLDLQRATGQLRFNNKVSNSVIENLQ